jgi:hypothetical protein
MQDNIKDPKPEEENINKKSIFLRANAAKACAARLEQLKQQQKAIEEAARKKTEMEVLKKQKPKKKKYLEPIYEFSSKSDYFSESKYYNDSESKEEPVLVIKKAKSQKTQN